MNKEKVVILFSGGTDSTLTAALMAEQYEKVCLITYDRFGLFSVKNTKLNAQKLKDKFGNDKFEHEIIKINKLFRYVSYERYVRNFIRYGFLLLSNCGFCKLTMHLRTVIYCLDNNINNVCDGANKGMYLFPDQMKNVIEEVKKMYATFGIKYSNPVFDFEGPQDTGFADKFHLGSILPGQSKDDSYFSVKKKTTGYKLFELGLMPSDNVKGTELDRQMQPRCFQFILFNIYTIWYYLGNHTYEEYDEMILKFHKEKLASFTKLLDKYLKEGKRSKLSRLKEK